MRKFLRELFGLFLLFWALLLFLGLVSYDSTDPSFNLVKSASGDVHNKAGLFGAYASGFLNDIFGVGSFLWPFIFAALGAAYISAYWTIQWWRWCGLFLLTLCLLMAASSLDFSIGDLSGGGVVGDALYHNGMRYLSPLGSFLIWFFVFLAGLQLACNIYWYNLASLLVAWLKTRMSSKMTQAGEADETAESELGRQLPDFGAICGNTLERARDLWRSLGRRKTVPGAMPDLNMEDEVGQSGMKEDEAGRHMQASDALNSNAALLYDEPFAISENLRESMYADAPPLENQEPQKPATLEQEEAQAAPLEKTDIQKAPVNAPLNMDVCAVDDFTVEIDPVASTDEQNPLSIAETMPRQVADSAPESWRGNTPREPARQRLAANGHAPLPSLDLLVPSSSAPAQSREDLKAKGQSLMACFRDFGINGELVRISPGPVVTMFEMLPASGISVKRIVNLSDDLSRALKAVAVRIQAPIPGSDTVGIEIPNDTRETVNFRELAECDAFQKSDGQLTMILGKDIVGRPYVADLARMPHLLVAGATGAGKSVCLNGILVSLLYRKQPDVMKLLLVDPKRIEMSAYADLPHLVHPVVTEMADAKNALEWAVHEMDNRYQAMARLGVRNVAAYNNKLAPLKNNPPSELADLEPMPYLVIVIDELADLMMTAGREVESSIVRLAQLARAAGIHMILATQRPSVDVVTGLIKANFPCRISFQVTSNQDSRTILGEVGAEHLLGRGDMLYKPSGVGLVRLHGPYLSDEEVASVVNHWKAWLTPEYGIDFSQWNSENVASSSSGGGDVTKEALYAEAKAFVLGQVRVSISLLQRRFQIGFNKAARYMEQFERDGLIGPPDGSKPRKVIH